MSKKLKKIIYVYNSAAYLHNFRLNLMLTMKRNGWEVVAVSPYDSAAEKIKAHEIRFEELELDRKGMKPLKDLGVLLRLIRIYRREKPSIVHHFTIKPVIYGTLAARLAGIPGIVNLVPGLGYVFSKGGLLQRLVEKMYSFAFSPRVQVVFQNPDDRQYFIEKKMVLDRQTHLICGSGVNTELFAPSKPKPSDTLPRTTFILIARMLWDKGVAEFADAAKIAKEKNPKVHFLLVGGLDRGNPAAIPESWLKEQRPSGFIDWIDHVDEIRPWLARADVAVLPSYREGAPRSLIEAMAMGKPIITTDVPGCREMVEKGVNGFLVPPKNAEVLAETMLKLANDPPLRKKMGLASRERAMKHFDEQIIIRETVEIYNQIRCV